MGPFAGNIDNGRPSRHPRATFLTRTHRVEAPATMPFTRTTFLAIVAILSLHAAALAGDAYKWSVQYLIDQSQSMLGKPQKVYPRHARGLAISPDGKFLYVGFLHSFDGGGEVRRIAIDTPDYERAVSDVLPGAPGKAIAV